MGLNKLTTNLPSSGLPQWLQRKSKAQKRDRELPENTFYWLAALVLMAQLPHLLHLPLWISITGVAIVALWVASYRNPDRTAFRLMRKSHALAIAALIGVAMVHLHYGYVMGRDPGVALLFMLTACKFAETRHSKDASILICLCGFLLMTQYFYSQTLIAGIITLPAVLAMGGALHSLAGNYALNNASSYVSSEDGGKPVSSLQVLRNVSVLLLQGLPIAVVLFVLFPRLPGPLWNLPTDAGGVTGLSDSMSPGSIASLSQSHEVAFRVEFDNQPPRPDQLYWRGPVLSLFDGRGWSLNKTQTIARIDYDLSASDTNSINDLFSYTVNLQPTHQQWMFGLEQPVSLPVQAQAVSNEGSQTAGNTLAKLTTEQQLITKEPVTRMTRYRMQSVGIDSYRQDRLPKEALTHLPGRNQKTIQFARQERAGAPDDITYARRMLQWFRQEPFHYTLRPGLLGDAPVDEFLFGTRRGFCEHYASAFTLLMRAAGIPSRVVTGYQGGEMNGDYMIVRQSDAHAWSEVWLDGRWQRFDPTAAVSPERIERGIASLPAGEPVPMMARNGSSLFRDWQLRWDRVNHNWQRMIVDFDNSRQHSLFKMVGLGKPTALHLALIILAVAAVWALILTRKTVSRQKPQDPAEQLWLKTCEQFARVDAGIGATETPSHFANRLQTLWPTHTQAIQQHFALMEKLRFSALDNDTRERLCKQGGTTLTQLQKLCRRPNTQHG